MAGTEAALRLIADVARLVEEMTQVRADTGRAQGGWDQISALVEVQQTNVREHVQEIANLKAGLQEIITRLSRLETAGL